MAEHMVRGMHSFGHNVDDIDKGVVGLIDSFFILIII